VLLITDNHIDRVDADAFSFLPTSTRVTFERNHMNCSCKNAWMFAAVAGGMTSATTARTLEQLSSVDVQQHTHEERPMTAAVHAQLGRDNYCSYPEEVSERALNALPPNYTHTCNEMMMASKDHWVDASHARTAAATTPLVCVIGALIVTFQ
jgi:hypothetical protein